MTGSMPASNRGRQQTYIKGEEYHTDSDRTRSMSPQQHSSNLVPKSTPGGMRIEKLLNDETPSAPPPTSTSGPFAPVKLGRGNWSKAKREAAAAQNANLQKQRAQAGIDTASPAASSAAAAPASAAATGPHGFYLPLNGSEPAHKRTRPLTAHQIAVEKYRKQRVDFILDRALRSKYKAAKSRRTREGAMARAWKQVRTLPDGFDSEEELHVSLMQKQEGLPSPLSYKGFAGFRVMEGGPSSYVDAADKENDFGEQAYVYRQTLSRVGRRLNRWEKGLLPVKRKKVEKVLETVEDGVDDDDALAEEDREAEGDADGEAEDGMELEEGRSSLPPDDMAEEADEELDEGDDEDEDEIMGDA